MNALILRINITVITVSKLPIAHEHKNMSHKNMNFSIVQMPNYLVDRQWIY